MHRIQHATLAFATLALTCPAQAGQVGDGLKGRDWNGAIVSIDEGHTAVITATNMTKNTDRGNKSGITYMVDGNVIFQGTVDRQWLTKEFELDSPGRHTIKILCSNEKAEADSCTLSIRSGDIIHI